MLDTLLDQNGDGVPETPNYNGWWNPEGGTLYSGIDPNNWNETAVIYNLTKMKTDYKLDHVRLHTDPQAFQDAPTYRDHMNRVCQLANELGMTAIVDFYGDPKSFSNIPAYWSVGANALKSNPNIIFESWNEPDMYSGFDPVAWQTIEQGIIDSIRATGATQPIMLMPNTGGYANVPPNQWVGPSSNTASDYWLYPRTDPLNNLYYDIHIYRESAIINQPESYYAYTKPQWESFFDVVHINEAVSKGYRVWIGEVGANMWWSGADLTRELSFFDALLNICKDKNIPATIWVWTSTAHMKHGILSNNIWLPPPNEAGLITQKYSQAQPIQLPFHDSLTNLGNWTIKSGTWSAA